MFSDDTPSLIINDGIQGSFHSVYFEIENRPVHFFDHEPVWRMSQKGFALSGPGTSTGGEPVTLVKRATLTLAFCGANRADCKLATTVNNTSRVGIDRFFISGATA